MSKKLGVLIAALCMSSGMAYAQMVGDSKTGENSELGLQGPLQPLPDYVEVDNSNPKGVTGLCKFIWFEDMTPMPVTVMFEDGSSETVLWQPAGVAMGAGGTWSLEIEPGNTWGRAWTLTTSKPITGLRINAFAGKVDLDGDGRPDIATVFDIRLGPQITDGSANGHPFTTVEGTGTGRNTAADPPPTLTATYEKPVFVGPPRDEVPDDHDLYAELHIEFDEPVFGSVTTPGPMFFRADTDCVLKVEGSLESDGNGGINARMTVEPGDQALLEKDGEEVGKIVFGEDCPNGFTCESVSDNEYRAEINLAAEPGSTYDLWALTADSQDWELVDTYPKD